MIAERVVILTGADALALVHHAGRELDRVRGRLDRSSRAYRVLVELGTAASLHAAEMASLRSAARCDDSAPQPGGEWLTVAMVADRLGLTEQAIRQAAAAGRLAADKDDKGRWQFTPGAVQEFEERRTRT